MAELVKLGPTDEALAHRMAEVIQAERGGDLGAWVSTVVNALCVVRTAEVFEMLVFVHKDLETGALGTFVHLFGNGIKYGYHTVKPITSENEPMLIEVIGLNELLKLKGLAERFGGAVSDNGYKGVAITAEQYRFFMGF